MKLHEVSNSNNRFKNHSVISLTCNKSLILCNSHNDKLIWKCIHLPKTCYDWTFCSRFRTNSLLPEIWFKHYQLWCSFARPINLEIWRNIVETYFSLLVSLFFFFFIFAIRKFLALANDQSFVTFTKRIVDHFSITSVPFNIGWLANFWRWATFDWFVWI